MVITVTCPSCSSSFPVDPEKVPPEGVNARCSSCSDIFRVERPSDAEPDSAALADEALTPPPLEEPAPSFAEEPAALDEVEVVPPPAPEAPPPLPEMPAPEPPVAVEAPDPAVAAPAPELPSETVEPAEPATAGFRFGKRDPTDKAKRLARVLVSDMIMYNADRHQTALEAGTLKEDFEEEIEKSWKEYVEQVGEDMAEGDGRAFWREALNDILAKGEAIF